MYSTRGWLLLVPAFRFHTFCCHVEMKNLSVHSPDMKILVIDPIRTQALLHSLGTSTGAPRERTNLLSESISLQSRLPPHFRQFDRIKTFFSVHWFYHLIPCASRAKDHIGMWHASRHRSLSTNPLFAFSHYQNISMYWFKWYMDIFCFLPIENK